MYLFDSLALLLIGLLGFWYLILLSLYILGINPLLDEQLMKIFSQAVDCLSTLVVVPFAVQKLFNSMQYHLSIVATIS
jgi:hypothetical protein